MIKDTYELKGFNTPKLPKLKGTVDITLRNVYNGKTEKVHGENIVTNAVRDIMLGNYLGKLDYGNMFPLWSKWYGGVLLYQNAHATHTENNEEVLDPNDYFLHGDNPLTAHAGDLTIDSSHDDNLKRGNPTTAAFQYSANSVKQVWEWGTTHGNGTISAISLTHKDVGNAGLGNAGYQFSTLFSPFAVLFQETINSGIPQADSLLFQYDENHGIVFTIQPDGTIWDSDNVTPTQNVNFYVKRLPYTKAGIYETLNADTDSVRMKKFTVQTSITFYRDPCYYWDSANKELWLFTNITGNGGTAGIGTWNKSTIQYTVLDLSDLDNPTESRHGTLTSDTADLAPIGWGEFVGHSRFWINQRYQVIKDGDAFWFPLCDSIYVDTSSGNRLGINAKACKRISLNSATQFTSTFNTNQTGLLPCFYGGDKVLISDNAVNYGSTGFGCASLFDDLNREDFFTRAFHHPQSPVSYVVGTDKQNYWNGVGYVENTRYIIANKMLNTTLFNLPTPIQKSASQAMTVEYTLTEVEPE